MNNKRQLDELLEYFNLTRTLYVSERKDYGRGEEEANFIGEKAIWDYRRRLN